MKIKLLLATLVALGVTAINSQAQSTDIVFTASAGFTNGNLSGQKNWTGSSWQVNTNGSGAATVTSNAPNGSGVSYGMGTLTLSNGYSGLADFSFTVGATNASQQGVFYMDILDSTTVPSQ
ncbi:MAG: hypothetical protein WCS94_01005 [Verrucomicrobiota bacterium]